MTNGPDVPTGAAVGAIQRDRRIRCSSAPEQTHTAGTSTNIHHVQRPTFPDVSIATWAVKKENTWAIYAKSDARQIKKIRESILFIDFESELVVLFTLLIHSQHERHELSAVLERKICNKSLQTVGEIHWSFKSRFSTQRFLMFMTWIGWFDCFLAKKTSRSWRQIPPEEEVYALQTCRRWWN